MIFSFFLASQITDQQTLQDSQAMSESQQSNWSLCEGFRGAGMDSDDEDKKPDTRAKKTLGKRRLSSAPASPRESMPKIEEELTPEQRIDQEFAKIRESWTMAEVRNPIAIIGLVGKKPGGAIYAPQECVYVVNKNDPDQIASAKKAIIAKANEWKKNNPKATEPFCVFEAEGYCKMCITAVGGAEYGTKNIPVAKKEAKKEAKKDGKKAAKKQKKG